MIDKGSTNYKIHDQNALYFVTMTIVGWVDIFTKKIYKDLVINSLSYCRENKGLEIYGYCIMSNHLHLIIKAKENFKLSDIIRDFKKYTSKEIIETIQNEPESRKEWMLNLFRFVGRNNPNNKFFQVWKQDNHPIELSSNNIIDQKLNYIHMNPVEQAIVQNEEDYIYSSARNFAELDYVLEIDYL
jgi:REP-associated tyrosine transposase